MYVCYGYIIYRLAGVGHFIHQYDVRVRDLPEFLHVSFKHYQWPQSALLIDLLVRPSRIRFLCSCVRIAEARHPFGMDANLQPT